MSVKSAMDTARKELDVKFHKEFPYGKMELFQSGRSGKWFANLDKVRPTSGSRSGHGWDTRTDQRVPHWILSFDKKKRKVFSEPTKFIEACQKVGIKISIEEILSLTRGKETR